MISVGAGWLGIPIGLAVFYMYLLGKLNEISQRGAYWMGLVATVVHIASASFLTFSEGPKDVILPVVSLAGMIVALICAGIIWRHDFGGG